MSENAAIILKNLKSKVITTNDLSQDDKKVLVFHLLEMGNLFSYEIAHIVGYSQSRIKQLKKDFKNEQACLIDDVDIKSVAVETMRVADIAKVRLAKNGQWAQVWRVQKELVEKLQELGFIHKEPISFKVSYDDLVLKWGEFFGITLPKQNANADN